MTPRINVLGVIPDISNRTSSQGWPIMKVKEKASKSNEKELVSDYTKLVLDEYNFISQTRIQ